MNRLTIIGFLIIALFFGAGIGAVANAADLQKGVEAYKKDDYETALGEIKPLAKEGDAKAQFFLGKMYFYGKGVPQNYQQAVQWYQLAAKQNNVNAQDKIAWMFFQGNGLPRDNINALMWFNIAISTGYETAIYQRNALCERSKVKEKMSKADIKTAKKRAKQCIGNNYKNC